MTRLWREIDGQSSGAPPASSYFFSGLDLGQPGEPSALAVLERTLDRDPLNASRPIWCFTLRHLERYPLGTGYHAVLADVIAKFEKPPLEGSTFVFDETGVGRPVADLFRRSELRALFRSVVITNGHTGGYEAGHLIVPKRELVSVLQMALQERRLKIPEKLPHAETLRRELAAFRPKAHASSDVSVDTWRDREFDDLVFAVGLAIWTAERERPAFPEKNVLTTGSPPKWWEDGPGWERLC
jgi:hypothetical protein